MSFASGFAAGSAAVQRGLDMGKEFDEARRKREFAQRAQEVRTAQVEDVGMKQRADLAGLTNEQGQAYYQMNADGSFAALDPTTGQYTTAPQQQTTGLGKESLFLGKTYQPADLTPKKVQGLRQQAMLDAAYAYDPEKGLGMEKAYTEMALDERRLGIDEKNVESMIVERAGRLDFDKDKFKQTMDQTKVEFGEKIRQFNENLGLDWTRLGIDEANVLSQIDARLRQAEQGDRQLDISQDRLVLDATLGALDTARKDAELAMREAESAARVEGLGVDTEAKRLQVSVAKQKLNQIDDAKAGLKLEYVNKDIWNAEPTIANEIIDEPETRALLKNVVKAPNGQEWSDIDIVDRAEGALTVIMKDKDGKEIGKKVISQGQMERSAKMLQGIRLDEAGALQAAIDATVDQLDVITDDATRDELQKSLTQLVDAQQARFGTSVQQDFTKVTHDAKTGAQRDRMTGEITIPVGGKLKLSYADAAEYKDALKTGRYDVERKIAALGGEQAAQEKLEGLVRRPTPQVAPSMIGNLGITPRRPDTTEAEELSRTLGLYRQFNQ